MFSDIANHWASQCIVALAQRGIVRGYPNRTFRPLATITRAEFAALMPKVFPELSEQQEPQICRDVPAQYWAKSVVDWAMQRGLVSLYADGTFRPRQTLSRVQAITALMKGLEGTQGVGVMIPDLLDSPKTAKKSDAKSDIDIVAKHFSDAATISADSREAIANALNQQLLEPIEGSRPLRPNKAITRGEVAALLCRALEIPASAHQVSYPAMVAAQNQKIVFERLLQQETGFDRSKLAFLNLGAHKSPYVGDIHQFAQRLQQPADVALPLASNLQGNFQSDLQGNFRSGTQSANTTIYPATGSVFFVNEGGLEFLPSDILSGCLCLSTLQAGELHGRWLGRDALSDRTLGPATKFIPLLHVATRANAADPNLDIGKCQVRSADSASRAKGYAFQDLANGTLTNDRRIANAQALALMFQNFATPKGLETWTQSMTGNQGLSLQGSYGETPFIESPVLWNLKTNKVVLKSPERNQRDPEPETLGDHTLSTYDLTRLLSMAAWHCQLPMRSRIPNLQPSGLASIIRAMALDPARYIDVALETLGLTEFVRSPVILSASGLERRHHAADPTATPELCTELTYCALAQFSLPRQIANQISGQTSGQLSGQLSGQKSGQLAPDPTAAYQRHSLCFTLVAAKALGNADQEARYLDALMATAVTAIIRRLVLGDL